MATSRSCTANIGAIPFKALMAQALHSARIADGQREGLRPVVYLNPRYASLPRAPRLPGGCRPAQAPEAETRHLRRGAAAAAARRQPEPYSRQADSGGHG